MSVSRSWSETFLVEKSRSFGKESFTGAEKNSLYKAVVGALVLVLVFCEIKFLVEMKEHLSKPHCPFVIFRTAWDDISLPQALISIPDFQENTASVHRGISIC